MEKSKPDVNQLKYLKIDSLIENNINKGDIFYRKKYNEVINYLKTILTETEDSISNSYVRFIQPKGCILINIYPGNDIELYLKLISKNYQLKLIELNYNEIFENPEDFFNNFPDIIRTFMEDQLTKERVIENSFHSSTKNENQDVIKDNYKLFIINESNFPTNYINSKYLLSRFIKYFENTNFFLKNRTILIWINSSIQEVENNHYKIYQVFDLFIKIPMLEKTERQELLKNFSENNPKIVFDINTIVENTQNWEVNDINQLLKVGIFKHFLNSELNDSSNEITDILMNLIDEGEFIPSTVIFHENNNRKDSTIKFLPNFENNLTRRKSYINEEQEKVVNEYITQIHNENISDFMLHQLYENAASKNYNELIIIIDKLNKNEYLEDNERKLLGKYPFILNDKPKMAQIYLEKGKKRIDQIMKAFGKNN
ncbi:MAG: hypothetical protein ACFFKA_02525 [Candidatus Thorarchaeota archaeon]